MRIRRGQGPEKLSRAAFRARFEARFQDPAFAAAKDALDRLEAIAWDGYVAGRKAPRTVPAGEQFADPKYDLSVEWLATRNRLHRAAAIHADRSAPDRILVISAAARNDKTCPGENAKSFELAKVLIEALEGDGAEVDLLDLSLLSSEYGRTIHPCKGCVSTAMPLCHWPCSCYPNHALGQTGDWMAEIYERWTRAHGVAIVTPVYWLQVPGGLKVMMDRLVCADGGNPDPTRTGGKDAERAKRLELDGWDYPKHLAGRAYGLVVHGDAVGAESLRRALGEWLDTMGLVGAGPFGALDRYIGYYEPYATSHDALERDRALPLEIVNVARALVRTARALRHGDLLDPGRGLRAPRPK
jgi:multimeric flavodoxin WrbA